VPYRRFKIRCLGSGFLDHWLVEVLIPVFVAIACELVSEEHREDVHTLLRQYGFTRIIGDVFESLSFRPEALPRLKRDIDRRTDSYDKVRMYQYPLDGVLVITALADKKWRKTKLHS